MIYRLKELLEDTLKEWECDVQPETVLQIADHLLANGVIVPPVKVGDKMYFDGKHFARHCAGEIMERSVDVVLTEVWATFRGEVDLAFGFEDFGKTVFLTREEAEKALAERSENETMQRT